MNTADKLNFDPTHKRNHELEKATRLLFNWSDCIAEGEKEYSERVRKIKLLAEMKNIISNELNESEQKILRMRYVEAKSLADIASSLSTSSSSVSRSLKRAEELIAAYMKYVLSFAQTLPEAADKPLDVRRAVASLFLAKASQNKIAQRIKTARTDRFISLESAALSTGIVKERLSCIEITGNPDTNELKKLITLYGVSADYIFFGVD